MYLLDTNHCFRLIARDPRIVERVESLWSARIVTAVTVVGELRYGASISDRKQENTTAVSTFLDGIAHLPITTAVAEHYGALKAAILKRFGPRDRTRRRQFNPSKLGFHDNDLWIASCALDAQLTLVSSDGDFTRIAEVSPLSVESWI